MRASVGPHTFLLMCMLAAGVVLADSPGLPVSLSSDGQTRAQLNGAYLRLDASNDPLTGELALANGSAALPALTWNAGGTNTGFFTASAGFVAFSSGGVQEMTLGATSFAPGAASGNQLGTSALPWLSLDVATGTAAAPSLKMGSTNSGWFGGASVINGSIGGVQESVLNATELSPFAASGLNLGTSALPFGSLDVAAGTVAAPSLRAGDTNSGVVGGADTVSVAVGGVSALTFGNGAATGLQYLNAGNDVTGSAGVVRSLNFPPRSIGPTIMAAPACVAGLLGAELTLDDMDDTKPGIECKCTLGADNVTYSWIYRRLIALNGNGWEGTGCAP